MINPDTIPKNPGCYLFKNPSGEIIYIGKAKNLKKRVSSYLSRKHPDPKTNAMLSGINSVDFIVTNSEIEALILENNLIKKHRPKYNIDLKDSKNYAYIKITDEYFPRLLITRNKTCKGKFYGPFPSAHERDYIFTSLKKTFKIRTCKRMPEKPCLRYHINACSAPCAGLVSRDEYDRNIDKIKFILSGKTKELLESMNKEMIRHSGNLNFESALELKNQINSLHILNEKQNADRQKKYDEDIINYIIKDDKVYLILFNIYKGTLACKNEFNFNYNPDFLEEFIIRYYSENEIPGELILPQEVDNSIISFLQLKRGKKIKVTIPRRGEKKQLLDLVIKNIELSFFGDVSKIEELKSKLHLEKNPDVIECFDISHLSGTSTVGSMVRFRNAKPDKSNYRRFKIRTACGIDDVLSIAEVVRRRYSRLKRENLKFPDLIIIDGGRGQLNSALNELEKLDLKISIPVISIAKKFEEIYVPKLRYPLKLDGKDKALLFIREIRDEAHRFAVKYNRLLRKKELLK